MTNKLFRKIAIVFGTIGPGLFMIGYNIGTGSVTTMASSGSRYGLGLFWVLMLSCVFTYVMLEAYGRLTVVSGETSMMICKKNLPCGKWLALYLIIALSVTEIFSIAGVMGIVTELISEWTHIISNGNGISMLTISSVIIAVCYYLFWIGKYTFFEKILSSLVVFMGGCFILSMFFVVPSPVELISGLIPSIPDEPNSFLFLASMAGTTCAPMVFVMRSIVVKEKGWTVHDLKKNKIDTIVSVSFMLILSGTIMACAAGTLYKMGMPVEKAVDMVKTLEPIAGKFAISIFVIGIIGAGISTIFPLSLVLPWLICDYRGTKRDLRSPMFRVLGGLALLTGLTVPLFGGKPVLVMLVSGALTATIMPLVTLMILILINNRDIMGKKKAGLWLNIGLVATLLFSCITTCIGIIGLHESLGKMLG